VLHFDEGRPLYFGIGSLRDVQVAPSCSFKMPVDRADRGDPEPRQPSEQKASSLLLPPTCECAYMVMRIQSAYIVGSRDFSCIRSLPISGSVPTACGLHDRVSFAFVG